MMGNELPIGWDVIKSHIHKELMGNKLPILHSTHEFSMLHDSFRVVRCEACSIDRGDKCDVSSIKIEKP